MSIPIRTGIAVATAIVKKLCRVLATYRTPIAAVIAAAVTAGTITSSQAAQLNAWLDATNAACDVIRLVSGY